MDSYKIKSHVGQEQTSKSKSFTGIMPVYKYEDGKTTIRFSNANICLNTST